MDMGLVEKGLANQS